MDDSTNCPVCFEPHEETGDHLPHLLPCMHTLCHTCVGELIHGNTLVCPQDRQAHAAINGVRSFHQNRYILNNLRKTVQEDDNFEMCTAHRKKKYYCCETCKMTTCLFCLRKHITHGIIIIYEEQETVTRLVNDLETYKGQRIVFSAQINT